MYLVTETFEGLLQLLSQLSLCLFRGEVVSVVHVLMLPQVRRDLAHLRVELHVLLLLLSEQNRVLEETKNNFSVLNSVHLHNNTCSLRRCVYF